MPHFPSVEITYVACNEIELYPLEITSKDNHEEENRTRKCVSVIFRRIQNAVFLLQSNKTACCNK